MQSTTKKAIKFLVDNGPVGCRDMASLQLCEKYEVPAYFSGCLTSTFIGNPKIKRGNYVLAVNAPQKILDEVKVRTMLPVLSIEKGIHPASGVEARMKIAKAVLSLYHNAYCVISPNLHTVLPCVALETPVLHLMPEQKETLGKCHGKLEERLSGMVGLFNSAGEAVFLNNKDCYNFDDPPGNPKEYRIMRERLVKITAGFTGYDSGSSIMEDDFEPATELIKLLAFDAKNTTHITKIIFKHLFRKASKSILGK